MFKGIWAAIQAVLFAMGWIKQRSDQATGAAVQRGEDAERELKDTDRADQAILNPALRDPAGVLGDPNNRRNKQK